MGTNLFEGLKKWVFLGSENLGVEVEEGAKIPKSQAPSFPLEGRRRRRTNRFCFLKLLKPSPYHDIGHCQTVHLMLYPFARACVPVNEWVGRVWVWVSLNSRF